MKSVRSGSNLILSGTLFWRYVMVLVVGFTLAGCGSQNDAAADTTQQTFTFKIPDTLLGSKVDLTAGTLTLTVSVDGVENQTITIAPVATDVTITLNSLAVGSRNITILFKYNLSPFGPLDVATATKIIDVVEGVDTPLSFATSDFVTAFIGLYGDKAWDFFSKLRDNGANIAGPNNQALTPVLTGARKTVFAAVDYIIYKQVQKGENINIAYPASGTVVNPRPIVVLKSSTHKENAQKFVDYYLSKEGQTLVVNTILIPARTDLKVLPLRVGMDQIKTIPVDWDWLGKNQQEVIGRFYKKIETGM